MQKLHIALGSALALSISGTLTAATLSGGSGTVTDVFAGGSISAGGGTTGAFLQLEAATGLIKFDPSLGTLTEVKFTTSFDSEFQLDLLVSDPINSGAPFGGSADAFAEAGFYFFKNGGASVVTIDNANLNLFSQAFGDPGDLDAFDSQSDSASSTSTESSINTVDFAVFTGSGSLDDVFAGIFFPVDSASSLDNAASIDISGNASLTNLSFSLLYTYTPIPEPGVAGLAMLAGSLALIRRRRSS